MDAATLSVRHLQLLGFAEQDCIDVFPALSTAQHLSTSCFNKHNEILLLAILHFLLSRIDQEFASAVLCFTCSDVAQKNILKRHMLSSLRNLQDVGKVTNLQTSVLSEAKGSDVWTLLYQLSMIAMEVYLCNKRVPIPSYIEDADVQAQYNDLIAACELAATKQQQYYTYANELHARLGAALDNIEKCKATISAAGDIDHEVIKTQRAASALQIIRYIKQMSTLEKIEDSPCVLAIVNSAYELSQRLNS